MSSSDPDLAKRGAQAIKHAFDLYTLEFNAITHRAKSRFEDQDWHGMQNDAIERLDLYTQIIKVIVADIHNILREEVHNKAVWSAMKAHYSLLTLSLHNIEIAETFFNSVSRRIFTTVGVDPAIEFIDSDFEVIPVRAGNPIFHSYYPKNTLQALFQEILVDYSFNVPYTDLASEAGLVADAVKKEMHAHWGVEQMERLDLLSTIFYRGQGAYLIGVIRLGSRLMPIVLSLRNVEKGIYVDAVLLTKDEVSILFSFSRSYFHVEIERPRELIFFLKSIIPLKPVAELYISLGFNKHGKTELYRHLMRHLRVSSDQFEFARGEKGMVMIVFTLHSVDMVFKVIRDRFAEPKTTTRQDVMDRYQLVFKHDRAGRLVDAQEFEHMRFEKARFSKALLEELLAGAPSCVTIEGDTIAIKHLYMERRLTPLNIYIHEVDEAVACEAALDYGHAIKDLAVTGIFPGDILLKNFGVTRHGRIIFYDYDELCLLEICKFKHFPEARNFSDDFEAEPWFYVGKNDIFPEEFMTFLGFQGKAREAFISVHSDLFEVEFWREIQRRNRAGEVVDILPYKTNRRIHELPLA